MFKDKFRKLRISSGVSIEQLTNLLNVTKETILSWEEGTSEPDIATIKTICNIFSVSVSELIDSEYEAVSAKSKKCTNREHIFFLVNTFLVIFSILITPFFILIMKDIIPIEYNVSGTITKYGSRKLGFLFIPLYIMFYLYSIYTHFRGYRKNNQELRSLVGIQAVLSFIGILIIVLNGWFAFSNVKNLNKDLMPFIIGALASFFIVLSIFTMPFINKNRNWILGVRTSFSLSNQEVWEKLNLFQGISGLVASITSYVIILTTFKTWNGYLIFLIIASIIPTLIYHEVLRFKYKKLELKE